MSTVCIDLDRYFTPPPGKLLSSGLLGSFLVILALQTFGALGRKIGVIPLAGVTYILWASTPGPTLQAFAARFQLVFCGGFFLWAVFLGMRLLWKFFPPRGTKVIVRPPLTSIYNFRHEKRAVSKEE